MTPTHLPLPEWHVAVSEPELGGRGAGRRMTGNCTGLLQSAECLTHALLLHSEAAISVYLIITLCRASLYYDFG